MKSAYKYQTLRRVKKSLRLTHDKFDEDVLLPMIEAGMMELKITGVDKTDDLTFKPLIERAIIHYCHINFPFGADHREIRRHERAFDSLRNTLAMVGDFNV